ncbi:MAG: branched-chain amino acid ABC transporter permease [Candidatus Rokuibacteriota bacterium]|nr:MAG: branched-chain amino acid ABC transporter permease [Candidatus Rokubacteria bacterium]
MELFAQLLLTGVVAGGSYALLAVGYTMVYGVLGFINFAHGDVAMIGAYLALVLSTSAGLPLPAAIVLAMAGAALLGVLVERVAYRPLRRAHRLAPLISAIAVSLGLESVALLVWSADIRTFHLPVVAGWQLGPLFVTPVQVVILVTAAVAMVLLQLLLTRTAIGKAIRATADNLPVAAIVGIDTDRVIGAVFALGSALAALAAALLALEANLHPTVGILMGIKAFAAVVLGGIGSVPGALVGGFAIGIAENLGVWYLPTVWKDAVAYAVLAAVLVVRPQGLFGTREAAEPKL